MSAEVVPPALTYSTKYETSGAFICSIGIVAR